MAWLNLSGLVAGAAFGFLLGFAFLLLCWSVVAGRRIAIDPKEILLFMAISCPVGLMLEVGCGWLHLLLFGEPLWQYRVMPAHGGFTSQYNFGLWPLYGAHLYFFHQARASWRLSRVGEFWLSAGKSVLSGPLLEIAINAFFLLCFGQYFFYYFPDDLWHLTSLAVIPYYAVSSLIL